MASDVAKKVSSQEERARKSNQQLTAMFLSVSITFLVLIIPSITVILIKPYVVTTDEERESYAYVESIVDCMAYLMHSSNFFLYCVTGAGFRRELLLLLGGWCGKDLLNEVSVTEQSNVQ